MSLDDVAWRPPTITTDRLVLRAWERRDREAVFAYASDAETTEFMAWDRHESLTDADYFLDDLVAAMYLTHELTYAVALAGQPEIAIGGVGVHRTGQPDRIGELGYVLSPEHWGRGYIPEAAVALVNRVWSSTDVERVFAPIFAPNTKSRRAAEKIGLQYEGVARSAAFHHGRWWDIATYATVRGDLD